MVKDSRYLTHDEKSAELRQWSQLMSASTQGPGAPDPEMVPWCAQINAIHGVCTLQSCAGHGPDEQGYRSSGHLWLRLDEERSHRFDWRAFELAQLRTIERISLIYQPRGKQVIEIEFKGDPDGQLEASLQAILAFLRSL